MDICAVNMDTVHRHTCHMDIPRSCYMDTTFHNMDIARVYAMDTVCDMDTASHKVCSVVWCGLLWCEDGAAWCGAMV